MKIDDVKKSLRKYASSYFFAGLGVADAGCACYMYAMGYPTRCGDAVLSIAGVWGLLAIYEYRKKKRKDKSE